MRYVPHDAAPAELVHVTATAQPLCPEDFRHRITVDTLHDGDAIPARLRDLPAVAALEASGKLKALHERERDWGANLVAEKLCAALGVSAFLRVNVARIVMDFNRFPGMSAPSSDAMSRLALSGPLADALDYPAKRFVLERCYDPVSRAMDTAILGRALKISIHTYDEHNPSMTRRPEVSLLTRSDSYQRHSRLPVGLFDPLFPDVLVESSSSSILRDRIALTLEKRGIAVEHNYPYCLPDGSVEVRCQPWFFFQHLRRLFEDAHIECAEDPAFTRVWEMLFNTNHRGGEDLALSGYLHRFRPAPRGLESTFDDAQAAYARIAAFAGEQDDIVARYRRSPTRTSAITIEVRKDLVWNFADDGTPLGPRDDQAETIANALATAIATYVREDR